MLKLVGVIVGFIRILFDMDVSDTDRNYSKYSKRYGSYKA